MVAYCSVIVAGPAGVKQVNIEKYAKNITRGEVLDQTNITATADDIIEFLLRVTSTGTATLDNVTVSDILPQKLIFIPGSVTFGGQLASNSLLSGGMEIGLLSAGQR